MNKHLNKLTFLLVLSVILSCNPDPEYSSGIYREFMDTTIHPGDDFHAFVNGTWIKNTEIPADKSSYGISMILHEKSQDDVKAIIEELA